MTSAPTGQEIGTSAAGHILSATNTAAESEGLVGKPALQESRGEETLQLLPAPREPSIHWYLLVISRLVL